MSKFVVTTTKLKRDDVVMAKVDTTVKNDLANKYAVLNIQTCITPYGGVNDLTNKYAVLNIQTCITPYGGVACDKMVLDLEGVGCVNIDYGRGGAA